jgi:hypothetical protein
MTGLPFDASQDAKIALLNREQEMLETMLSEYNSARWPDAAPWRVVSAERLVRIWEDAAKTGFVRDEKGLLAIRDRFIDNFLRLSVNTAIAGHSEYTYSDILEDHFDDADEIEKFVHWAIDTDSGWRISDYALSKLFPLCAAATEATDPAQVLMLCDLMLNVVHQRSDLSSWFVAGGWQTLTRLAVGTRPSDTPEPASAPA